MSKKVWPGSADVKKASKEGAAVFREFREFALKGSMVDMAVGIIIGAAFGTVVKSLVTDIVMPPFGLVLGNRFTDLKVVLGQGADGTPVTINYGLFLDNIISFLIVSFAVFLMVKQMNRFRRQEAAAPTTRECPYCLSTIPIAAKKCAHCTSEVAEAGKG